MIDYKYIRVKFYLFFFAENKILPCADQVGVVNKTQKNTKISIIHPRTKDDG